METIPHIRNIPEMVIPHVFVFLSGEDLSLALRVCKEWGEDR